MSSNGICAFKLQSSVHLPLKGLALDKHYYIPNADLHFQVEQTIFRVHSYFFTRESPSFRERMAGADCARSGAHDGLMEKTAIPVLNTTAEEFSHFLWVFYNPSYLHSAPAAVWRVVLTLSAPTRWDFPQVHALALHHLKQLPLPVVDRIVLYKDCSVPFIHLLPLFVEVCTRDEWITLQESVQLGWELAVSISQVRERLLRGEGKGGPNDDTILCMGGAIEQVSKERAQELIKSTLNITQDVSSVMGLQERHTCSPQRDTFTLLDLNAQTKATTGTTKRISSRERNVKTQALHQVSKYVQKFVPNKGKSSVNA